MGCSTVGMVVLVTGVARHLGARFVAEIRRLPGVDLVVGVDVQPPRHPVEDPDGPAAPYRFQQLDLRRPAVARVIAEHRVDTVVHLAVSATGLGSTNRSSVKESNVIGTMQLLGACQKAPGVRRLVVKSTTGVYGSAPRDPAVFTERTQPKNLPGGGFAKDAVEVEGYVRGFARRRPDVAVTVLRFANIVGPGADTPLGEYFALPVLPTVLGYDPRLQFAHEDDVVAVLCRAARPRSRTPSTPAPSTWRGRASCCSPSAPAGSAGRPCRCCCPRSAGWRRWPGRPGWSTSRPSSCGC